MNSVIWYLNREDIAAVARHMADNGASADEVASMVEKPWKYSDEWDALTAEAEAARDTTTLSCGCLTDGTQLLISCSPEHAPDYDLRSAPGWNGAGSDTPNGDMEVGRG